MNKIKYQLIEKYMLECMSDTAHDKEHIYRVLFVGLDIASSEKNVDYDVLITACLLHDIARDDQFKNPKLCHATVGAKKAYDFLIANNFSVNFAQRVASCIKTHRFRGDNPPTTIEEKILFDADKIDATGTIGIARTILYNGQVNEPLYSLDENRNILDGTSDKEPSFFHEYKYKLEKVYAKFYTRRGKEIALQRENSAINFYENMLREVVSSYELGKLELDNMLK